jgi:hypothetical protein
MYVNSSARPQYSEVQYTKDRTGGEDGDEIW